MATSGLHDAEHKNCEESVFHADVIRTLQRLFPNSQQFFLHGLLHIFERKLCETKVLFGKAAF